MWAIELLGQGRAEQAYSARRFVAAIDDDDRRPRGELINPTRSTDRKVLRRCDRRDRRDEHTGHLCTARPFDGDLACVPGGRTFFAIGIVVFVKHDDCAKLTGRAERSSAGPDDDGTGCGSWPLVRQKCHAQTRPAEAARKLCSQLDRRNKQQRVAMSGGCQYEWPAIRTRTESHHRPDTIEACVWPRLDVSDVASHALIG